MTEKGCTREDSGEFVHATLDPKSGRCFIVLVLGTHVVNAP